MIPNSMVCPVGSTMVVESLELYKRGTRNVLWLTVREGRRFILKGLPEELREHPEEEMRLRKEYSLGLRISHPGVVGVYGYEQHPVAGPVIVMEYVDGATLEEFLNKKQPLKMRVSIARQISDALAYMHSMGLSHRDLKPDNVLITRRNEAKIIDIGLGDSEDSVFYKQSMATEKFGAPEQQKPYIGDSRADVYSFGKLLELLLPEARFKKLRARCLQTDPEKRITMVEVPEILGGKQESSFSLRSIILGCFLVAVVAAVGFIAFRDTAEKPPIPHESTEIIDDNSEKKDVNVEEISRESIEEDGKKETSAVQKEKLEISGQGEEKVIDHENAMGEQKYEKIYDKYMAELYDELNRLGCGFDAAKGMPVDSIAQARAIIAPAIMNRMVDALSAAGCPYNEMTRLSNLMFDNMDKAIEKLDGRKVK